MLQEVEGVSFLSMWVSQSIAVLFGVYYLVTLVMSTTKKLKWGIKRNFVCIKTYAFMVAYDKVSHRGVAGWISNVLCGCPYWIQEAYFGGWSMVTCGQQTLKHENVINIIFQERKIVGPPYWVDETYCLCEC